MSVRGEFKRAVGDAAAALRVAQESELAELLDRACDPDAAELEAVADAVLAAIASVGLEDYGPAADQVENLVTLCGIIRGR